MSERFCLKWNNFQSTVSNSFEKLRKEKDFFDVTLVSEDLVQLQAHKIVLSACSDFFKTILKANNHSNLLLYLNGIDSQKLGFVLDYVYKGEVQIYQDQLDSFLDSAQKLKIEGLLNNETDENQQKFDEQVNEEEVELEESVVRHTQEYFETKILTHAQNIESYRVAITDNDNDNKFEVKKMINDLISKNSEGIFSCKSCGKTMSHISNMQRHVETHLDGISYNCPQCNMSFRSKNAFSTHKSRFH